MNRRSIYKCNICGKVIEILKPGAPETVCCGQPMVLMKQQSEVEKHTPKISVDGKKVTVDVGISMGSPEHWIMWIELICKDEYSIRKFLNPTDSPKATFVVADTSGLKARSYCSLHGNWISEK